MEHKDRPATTLEVAGAMSIIVLACVGGMFLFNSVLMHALAPTKLANVYYYDNQNNIYCTQHMPPECVSIAQSSNSLVIQPVYPPANP